MFFRFFLYLHIIKRAAGFLKVFLGDEAFGSIGRKEGMLVFVVPAPVHEQCAFLKVEVLHLEVYHLAHAQATAVEQYEQTFVLQGAHHPKSLNPKKITRHITKHP